MEALEIFFLSIAIGLIVHLLVRWSERQKVRKKDGATEQSSQTTGESAIGSALGEVERELRKSLSDESDTSRCADDATACASCTDSCSEAERALRRVPRIVYYDDEELDVLAHRPIPMRSWRCSARWLRRSSRPTMRDGSRVSRCVASCSRLRSCSWSRRRRIVQYI